MKTEKSDWFHRYRDGEAAIEAFLDDYALLLLALKELYLVTFDSQYASEAAETAGRLIRLFEDSDHGGFFFRRMSEMESLPRFKDAHDGALASGNANACAALFWWGRFFGNADLEKKAERALISFSENIRRMPVAQPALLFGLEWLSASVREIVIIGEKQNEEARAMLTWAAERITSYDILLFISPEDRHKMKTRALVLENREKPAAFICRGSACDLPVYGLEALKEKFN